MHDLVQRYTKCVITTKSGWLRKIYQGIRYYQNIINK